VPSCAQQLQQRHAGRYLKISMPSHLQLDTSLMADEEYQMHSDDSFIDNDLGQELDEETLDALREAGNLGR
jgi:hypothetical protein